MAFQISPGINVTEIDLTSGVPSVATTEGAIAGVFGWGPVGKILQVDSEDTLKTRYGKPTSNNYETFFVGADFLAYSNALDVSRAAVTTGYSNTLSTSLNGNTTVTIASNTATNGLSGTRGVYGPGITTGTTATFTSNATHTIATLSSAASLGNSSVASVQSVQFFDTTYSFNAAANSATASDRKSFLVKNSDHFLDVTIPAGVEFVAKYPGELGNSLRVATCFTPEQYGSTVNPFALTVNSSLSTNSTVIPTIAGLSVAVNSSTANVYISNSATLNFASTYAAAGAYKDSFTVGDYIEVGNASIGTQYLKVKAISALSNTNPLSPTGEVYFNLTFDVPYRLSTDYSANTVARHWEFFNDIPNAPGTSDYLAGIGGTATDEISIVVVDEDGKFSDTPGKILERYENLSRATDAKTVDGAVNYYKTVLNEQSPYIWAGSDLTSAPTGLGSTMTTPVDATPWSASFVGGLDGSTETSIPFAALATAYDLFADVSTVEASLIMAGKSRGGTHGEQLSNYLVDNIAEQRKDCVIYTSPDKADVVGTGVDGLRAANVKEFREACRSSSYLFLDSGYKYRYDRYNDVYRWVPLNGDMAGLAARSESMRDAWWSPAGFSRGQIKNVVKLAFNPTKPERDILYKSDINPVVTFPGQGTVLFGDKTALGKTSAFDRINVRRLFIILEKAIATYAQDQMFEFNDEFTRAQFKNKIEPYLRTIKGKRGIIDFKVVCDTTNNTAEIIDSNTFVGSIYIKPSKSINFIELQFVAVRSGVEFNEIVGRF